MSKDDEGAAFGFRRLSLARDVAVDCKSLLVVVFFAVVWATLAAAALVLLIVGPDPPPPTPPSEDAALPVLAVFDLVVTGMV